MTLFSKLISNFAELTISIIKFFFIKVMLVEKDLFIYVALSGKDNMMNMLVISVLKYSQSILSWMIHHANSISKAEIASIFAASDSNADCYMDFINRTKLFDCVCKIGARVESIRFAFL